MPAKHFPPKMKGQYITASTWSVFGDALLKKIDAAKKEASCQGVEEPLNSEVQVEKDEFQVGNPVVQDEEPAVQVQRYRFLNCNKYDETRNRIAFFDEVGYPPSSCVSIPAINKEVEKKESSFCTSVSVNDLVKLSAAPNQFVVPKVKEMSEVAGELANSIRRLVCNYNPPENIRVMDVGDSASNLWLVFNKDPGRVGMKVNRCGPDPPSNGVEGKEFNKIPP